MKFNVAVIDEFNSWIESRKQIFEHCLNSDLKFGAYKLLSSQKNIQLLKLVAEVYEFSKDNHLFAEFVEVFNDKGRLL